MSTIHKLWCFISGKNMPLTHLEEEIIESLKAAQDGDYTITDNGSLIRHFPKDQSKI